MKDRLKNIEEMETILNRTDILINELEILLNKWEENQLDFAKLMNYYGSEEWQNDLQADEDGEIPQDFPRGVLSEDAVYNAFSDYKNLAIRMIKTGVSGLE